MNQLLKRLIVPLGFLALAAPARMARAADATAPAPLVLKDQTQTTRPNPVMLHSGMWLLGLSYVPVVIVAAVSDRHGDKNLYVPVAGPWMDLATRGDCPPGASCNNETLNKVLIVTDGVFQGLGALNILGAFIFPETRTVTASASKDEEPVHSALSVRVAPALVAMNTYGVAATGTF